MTGVQTCALPIFIDWYDKQQCHTGNAAAHDRSNGRIYKIVYGDKKAAQVDLAKLTDGELVKLLAHPNDCQARHARRILQKRFSNIVAANSAVGNTKLENLQRSLDSFGGKPSPVAAAGILRSELESFEKGQNTAQKLQRLWCLHSTLGLSKAVAGRGLKSADEHLRAWTIQLLCEDKQPGAAALSEFARLAKDDPSPVVRLYLASACQRLTVAERLPIVESLLAHAEDATDHNLPLMYWYAAEPIVAEGPAKAVGLLAKAKIPIIREYITRRMAAGTK